MYPTVEVSSVAHPPCLLKFLFPIRFNTLLPGPVDLANISSQLSRGHWECRTK